MHIQYLLHHIWQQDSSSVALPEISLFFSPPQRFSLIWTDALRIKGVTCFKAFETKLWVWATQMKLTWHMKTKDHPLNILSIWVFADRDPHADETFFCYWNNGFLGGVMCSLSAFWSLSSTTWFQNQSIKKLSVLWCQTQMGDKLHKKNIEQHSFKIFLRLVFWWWWWTTLS